MRRILLAMLAMPLLAAPLAAQATADQARLVFTPFLGYNGGGELWDVDKQPAIFANGVNTDTFAVGRKIRDGFGVGLAVTYYPNDILGYGAEGYLIGLGYEDRCTHLYDADGAIPPEFQDVSAAVCDNIQGREKASSTVYFGGSVTARFNSRKRVSPYLRGGVGMLISSQSSLRMVGDIPEDDLFYLVYDDDKDTRLSPTFVAAAGATVAIASGYQLRVEARENIAGFKVVTGPTARDGLIPPSETKYKGIWTFSIGFDIVLERKRGRRY